MAGGVVALGLAACGGGTGTTAGAAGGHGAHGRSGRVGIAVTPGGGRGAQGPPIAAHPTPALIPPANAQARSVTVPVLTYHRVAPLSAVGLPDLKVDPADFAAELSALQAGGYHTIHQSQLFAALYSGAVLPSRPIIISVDDGYADDIRTILPDLQRQHMVATFFVITGRMTEPGFLTADQIRQLDRAGMDVGDHTAHHVDLRAITPSELRMETAGSRRTLQAVLGHPVYYFAYPFGAYDDAVVQAVKAAGFTMAYTTGAGTTESTSTALTWPRIHVGGAETPAGLTARLGGR
ncbi:MAG: polysaccharide deacetylase family protein [Actinomycetota bacterium]|nr:polysaccharide deacetylase family protein [Actinomycetota bacterium]